MGDTQYSQPRRKKVATTSASRTPLTTNPIFGQLRAKGRPMRSGTERCFAAAMSGWEMEASSERGSIQNVATRVARISPATPP